MSSASPASGSPVEAARSARGLAHHASLALGLGLASWAGWAVLLVVADQSHILDNEWVFWPMYATALGLSFLGPAAVVLAGNRPGQSRRVVGWRNGVALLLGVAVTLPLLIGLFALVIVAVIAYPT